MSSRALALLTAVVSLSSAVLAAADSPAVLSNYRITSWSGGDGITFGAVRSIVQDPDGYIWLASDAGLVRFDGFRFATTDMVAGPRQLPVAPLRAVYLARDGSLWAGYGNRHGIYRILRGEVRDIFLSNEVTGFVNAMTEDSTGAVWVAHDTGLYRFEAGRWESISLPPASATRLTRRVFDAREDRAGTLWVATGSGVYRRRPGGEFDKVLETDAPVQGISEDHAGHMWATDEITGFRRVDAPDPNPTLKGRGLSLFHDRAGNLWVATTGQGLWQVQPRAGLASGVTIRRATAQTGLISDELKGFLEDRDGNIWTGSIQGLNRLTPYKVTPLGDLGVVQHVTLTADGTAWAGTTSGLVVLTGVTPQSPGRRTVISPAAIRALHTASDGTVWAATEKGLYRAAGWRLTSALTAGPMLTRITSIDSDRRGTLWLSDETEGLVRVVAGRGERVTLAGLPGRPLFVHTDHVNRLWMAFPGGTIGMVDGTGNVRRYGHDQGLPAADINVIHHDRRGDVWVGGEGGLSLLRGDHFQTLTVAQGLPDRPVMAIIDDDAGDVWMAFAFRGFVRFAREDLLRAMRDSSYRLHYRVFNTSDGTAGVPYPVNRTPAGRDSSGALWFVTTRGLTVLDPDNLRNELIPMPSRPRIEGVTADDLRYAAIPGTVLPPRTGRLRIDYTVVNPSLMDQTAAANVTPARIRFRYRLDGFDTNWVDGTGPRQAVYTNLGPGRYRFRLQTAGDAAIWNDAETGWAFSIQPMFYQTGWFYLACVLALGLSAIGAWQLRMRQVRKDLALVFGERMRISREIHDTLLQSMFGVALQLDAAAHYLPDPPSPARLHIQRIRRQIEDHIAEARQSILNLRAPVLDRRDLVGALRETGDRLTAGKVPLIVTVNGTPRHCSTKVETHVLRIGHEAIANAVRHADAGQVHVDIRFDAASLRLRVADDGRGFDPGQQSDGTHYGLLSMQERAVDAGGRCTIASTPGGGVEVIAEFPLVST
jgi:signal transduction histidine kinase